MPSIFSIKIYFYKKEYISSKQNNKNINFYAYIFNIVINYKYHQLFYWNKAKHLIKPFWITLNEIFYKNKNCVDL